MKQPIAALAAAGVAGILLAATPGAAKERQPPPAPRWALDYMAKDTFGPQIFAVRPVSAECETRLGTHLTSKRLFTQWWMRSRRSYCR
jgi:hypothetical protein